MKLFQDRSQAGQLLANALIAYKKSPNTLIFALPRGGVPVAYEVAKALQLPLDVWLVRKLGVPGQEELAMGAISLGNMQVFNQEIIGALHIPVEMIDQVIKQEQHELQRRNKVYRHNQPFPDVKGKTIILIDDGIATGASMRVAIAALKQQQPAKIIVAIPVAALDTCQILESEVDEVVCLNTPESFSGVGMYYSDFAQTTDQEVSKLLTHIPPLAAGTKP